MSQTTFRSVAEAPEVKAPDVQIETPKYDDSKVSIDIEVLRPVENGSDGVLAAMGIKDSTDVMPEEERNNLAEVGNYINDILVAKGINPTVKAYTKVLNDVKEEMGLDEDADPSTVLDRIGGVVKAWKNLTFMPAEERRKAFMKLARLQSSGEMNKGVFDLMENYKVWK